MFPVLRPVPEACIVNVGNFPGRPVLEKQILKRLHNAQRNRLPQIQAVDPDHVRGGPGLGRGKEFRRHGIPLLGFNGHLHIGVKGLVHVLTVPQHLAPSALVIRVQKGPDKDFRLLILGGSAGCRGVRGRALRIRRILLSPAGRQGKRQRQCQEQRCSFFHIILLFHHRSGRVGPPAYGSTITLIVSGLS